MAIRQILKVWEHEFPHNEQAVALAMADHANEDGTGIWPSNDRIAHKTGYAKRTVQSIKRKMRKKGFLVVVEDATRYRPTEYRFDWSAVDRKPPFNPGGQGCKNDTPQLGRGAETGGQGCSHGRFRGAATDGSGVQPRSPEPLEETSDEPSRETRGEGDEDDPPGDDTPKPESPMHIEYDDDDWQHRFAQACYGHMNAAGVISSIIDRKAKRDPAGLLDDWADTFRLLHEQDGYDPVGEIAPAMRWLFTVDENWVDKGWLCSANTLRKKTRGGDRTKFDAIFKQYQRDLDERQADETDRRRVNADLDRAYENL